MNWQMPLFSSIFLRTLIIFPYYFWLATRWGFNQLRLFGSWWIFDLDLKSIFKRRKLLLHLMLKEIYNTHGRFDVTTYRFLFLFIIYLSYENLIRSTSYLSVSRLYKIFRYSLVKFHCFSFRIWFIWYFSLKSWRIPL